MKSCVREQDDSAVLVTDSVLISPPALPGWGGAGRGGVEEVEGEDESPALESRPSVGDVTVRHTPLTSKTVSAVRRPGLSASRTTAERLSIVIVTVSDCGRGTVASWPSNTAAGV